MIKNVFALMTFASLVLAGPSLQAYKYKTPRDAAKVAKQTPYPKKQGRFLIDHNKLLKKPEAKKIKALLKRLKSKTGIHFAVLLYKDLNLNEDGGGLAYRLLDLKGGTFNKSARDMLLVGSEVEQDSSLALGGSLAEYISEAQRKIYTKKINEAMAKKKTGPAVLSVVTDIVKSLIKDYKPVYTPKSTNAVVAYTLKELKTQKHLIDPQRFFNNPDYNSGNEENFPVKSIIEPLERIKKATGITTQLVIWRDVPGSKAKTGNILSKKVPMQKNITIICFLPKEFDRPEQYELTIFFDDALEKDFPEMTKIISENLQLLATHYDNKDAYSPLAISFYKTFVNATNSLAQGLAPPPKNKPEQGSVNRLKEIDVAPQTSQTFGLWGIIVGTLLCIAGLAMAGRVGWREIRLLRSGEISGISRKRLTTLFIDMCLPVALLLAGAYLGGSAAVTFLSGLALAVYYFKYKAKPDHAGPR